jgi:hypothetical protein
MSWTLWLLVGFCLWLSLMFFLFSITKYIESSSLRVPYYEVASAQHRSRQAQAREPESSSPIQLSVIYKVKSGNQALKEQIECLASIVREHFGDACTFEIVCVVSPKNPDHVRYVHSLCQSFPFLVTAARETSGLKWLIHGLVLSHGALIVDARFLAGQIDSLMAERFSEFCLFAEPIAEVDWLTPKEFRFPIAFSRAGGTAVLSKLTLTGLGCGNELVVLCQESNVSCEVVKVRFGPPRYSLVDSLTVWLILRWVKFIHEPIESGQPVRVD